MLPSSTATVSDALGAGAAIGDDAGDPAGEVAGLAAGLVAAGELAAVALVGTTAAGVGVGAGAGAQAPKASATPTTVIAKRLDNMGLPRPAFGEPLRSS